jgi:CspA family cold shock protein
MLGRARALSHGPGVSLNQEVFIMSDVSDASQGGAASRHASRGAPEEGPGVRGQVKWFDPKKGFGFIHGPEGEDVFVHYSQIAGDGFRSLSDGQWVQYELVDGDKGLQARGVAPVPTPAPEGTPEGTPEDAPEAAPAHADAAMPHAA